MEKEGKIAARKGASIYIWVLSLTTASVTWYWAPGSKLVQVLLLIGGLASLVVLQPRAQTGLGLRGIHAAIYGAVFSYSMLLMAPPVLLPMGAWNSGWTYHYHPLRPGHRPACDMNSAFHDAKEKFKVPDSFHQETPHFDQTEGHCDCSLPDAGMEDEQCERPPGSDWLPKFTVVTSIVDIGHRSRSGNICKELELFYPHLLRDVPMVIFAEQWAVTFARTVRKSAGLSNKTKIIMLTRNSKMLFYPLLDRMMEIADRNYAWNFLHRFAGGNAGKTVGAYDWINHQKADFMLQAAEDNHFSSDYFMWIDSGVGHEEQKIPKHFCPCNIAIPGKVTLFHRAPTEESLFLTGTDADHPAYFLAGRSGEAVPLSELTLERYESTYYLKHDFREITGRFWGGDLTGLRQFFKQYSEILHKIVEADRIDHDEAVLALLAASKPSYLRFVGNKLDTVQHLC